MKTMHATILRLGSGRRSRPACSIGQACLGLAALLAVTLAAGTAQAQSYTWTQTAAGTYTWGASPSNWGSGFPNAAGDTANLNINLAGAQTINLDQTITLGTLNIGDTTSSYFATTIAAGSGGSLVLDVTSGSATISKATAANSALDVISANIQLNDDLSVSNASTTNSSLNLSGVISESGGSKGIAFTGGGSTFLSGTANTYTGQTSLLNGTLRFNLLGNVGSAGSLGSPGLANATIKLGSGANAVTLLNGGTVAQTSNRVIDLAGTTGKVVISQGSFPNPTTANLTLSSDFTATGSGAKTLQFFSQGGGNIEAQGKIVDSAGGATSVELTSSAATIALTATASTYTGKTFMSFAAGNPNVQFTKIANAGQPSSFGQATGTNAVIDIVYSQKTLQFMGTVDNTTDRPLNLIGPASGDNLYTIRPTASNATLTFTSDFTSNWTSSATANTLSKILVFEGVTSRQGKIRLEGKLVDANTAGGRLLGVRVTDSTDSDFVTLTGLSTYTGSTQLVGNAWLTINSIKNLGEASAIGAPSSANGTLSFGDGGTQTLRYTGTSDTTDRPVQLNPTADGRGGRIEMAGSGTLKFTSNVISAGANSALLTLQGATSGVGEIAGIISSATAAGKTTSVVKSGTGTWVLSGNNTYTGTTSVSAGQLFINGNQSSATGAVSVAAGATLGGSGTVGGATTFSGASFLRPGSSGTDTGVLAFANNLSLSTTGTSFIDITGTTRGSLYDGVNVSGSLGYGGQLQFNIASLVTGTFDVFNFTSGSSSGNFAGIAGSIGATPLSFTNASGVWTSTFTIGSTSGTATFTQATGDLVIVPEPGTLALAVIGSSGLAWLAFRRRRNAADAS